MSTDETISGEIPPAVLLRVLRELVALDRDELGPTEAHARLRAIGDEHPEVMVDLVSEAQELARKVHYDALLRFPGRGTVSMSFCGPKELPWPLRGVHHAREYELLSVNGRVLTVEDAITSSDTWWNQAPVAQWLVDRCLMDEAIEHERLRVSDEEVRTAVENFRVQHGLFSGESTEDFLVLRGMTLEVLDRQVGGELLRRKLREHVVGNRIDPYFAEHARSFDVARIARFDVADLRAAEQLFLDLKAGKVDFFDAAERGFAAGTTQNGRLFSRIRRGNLEPEQARLVFGAGAGDIVGPIASGERFDVVRVLSIDAAVLDATTREEIAEALFAEWLHRERETADVQWFWGRARDACP